MCISLFLALINKVRSVKHCDAGVFFYCEI
jgi:hypothetical protein